MLIKLGIIAGIIVFGGIIFSDEIKSFFPNSSGETFDLLKDDISDLSLIASDSIENKIDSSIDKIVDKTSDSISTTISDEINTAGNKISNEISDVKESSQQIIKEKISNFNLIESIQSILTIKN
ncbi:MAG: hypothetical protein MAG458_00575 [Nitrosopumilus sp.]|nr:hypothetical protein [Nitrosopumilus sp.]